MDLATACLCSIKPKTILQRLGGEKNTLEILFRVKSSRDTPLYKTHE